MKNFPTGNITFLFTDIEGSTKLAQDYPDTIQAALEIHHGIMQKVIEANNGFVFEIVGDAFCCAFEKAEDAVKAAVDAQLNLANEKWKDAVIKIRIGIHSGNAEWNGKRYMGYIALARTARVMSAAYGEQIIISNDANENIKKKIYDTNDPIRRVSDQSEITFRDLGERRLKDVNLPVRLFQILNKGLRKDFPPLKTLDARPNNLPVQLTNFIGREEEIKQVKELFKDTHLLTLTGSGGAGKTRFALQTGADIIDDFINGVWFIEFAAISDPYLMPQSLLNTFGIKEEPGRTPEQTLTDYLKDKEILIILDNCEHLIEACSGLTENLLSSCPKLKIIATSREALNCLGEQTYRIPSLSQPDPEANDTPEQLTQYESVRLFIERALAVSPKFRVNNENAPALAAICSHLDGIPLAIELAAARIMVLSLEKIYERLDDRFNLLTGGKRTALPRQQTLRAMIEWSYDLLTENEKLLWSRLSVFTGGWTLEGAEEVCSGETINKNEILDLLGQLTEKSIIIYDETNERYRMLESMKEFGKNKLNESDDSGIIFEKHLDFFTVMSETAASKLSGNEVKLWMSKLDSNHSNIQSAIEWSAENVLKEKSAQIACSMGKFWSIRGYYSTGNRLLGKVLVNSYGISKELLAKVYDISGVLCYKLCEYDRALNFYEESLVLNRELGDKKNIATYLLNIGSIELRLGNSRHAKENIGESLKIFKELDHKPGIANSLLNLAAFESSLGNTENAKKLHEESLAMYRELGEKNGIALELLNLGSMEHDLENYEQSIKLYKEGLALAGELGDKRRIGFALTGLGNVYRDLNKYEESGNCLKESLQIVSEIGDKRGMSYALFALGKLSIDQKFEDNANTFFNDSLKLAREIGDKQCIANTLHGLGVLTYSQQQYELSRKYLDEGLKLSLGLGDKGGIAENLLVLAKIFNAENLPVIAMKILGAIMSEKSSKLFSSEKLGKETLSQIIKDLRDKFDDEKFEKYFDEGKGMTLEEAVQLAVNS